MPEVVWERGAAGGDIFDAWLVAQMRALGMDRACTYKGEDVIALENVPFSLSGNILSASGIRCSTRSIDEHLPADPSCANWQEPYNKHKNKARR